MIINWKKMQDFFSSLYKKNEKNMSGDFSESDKRVILEEPKPEVIQINEESSPETIQELNYSKELIYSELKKVFEEAGRATSNDNLARRRVMGLEHEYSVFGGFSASIDCFLINGGRIYRDCGHLEYASPETSNALDALIYDKAGEIITLNQARESYRNAKVFRNNVDIQGNNFGTHENYMLKRGMNLDLLVPFLATRILFTGSGYLTAEGKYKISQKADFIERATGGDSTSNKGLISGRDETHMSEVMSQYMRLHVTGGEANMSEVAGFLKIATTSLVLNLLEDGKIPEIELLSPVETMQNISTNTKGGWRTNLSNSRRVKVVDIQKKYLVAAKQEYGGRDEITDLALGLWQETLDALDTNPELLGRTVDWVIKKNVLQKIAEKNKVEFSSKQVQNANLQYHDIDRETGLFYLLEKKGLVARMLTDEQITLAVNNAPKDTRAYIRGEAVNLGRDVDWDHISKISVESIDTKCVSCPSSCKMNSVKDSLLLHNPLNNYKELLEDKKIGDVNSGVEDYKILMEYILEQTAKQEEIIVNYKPGMVGLARIKADSRYAGNLQGYGQIGCTCDNEIEFITEDGNSECVSPEDLELAVPKYEGLPDLRVHKLLLETYEIIKFENKKVKGTELQIDIGMKAEIRPDSEYTRQHIGVGTIFYNANQGSHPLEIKWPDGYSNVYRPSDVNVFILEEKLEKRSLGFEDYNRMKCIIMSDASTPSEFKDKLLNMEKKYVELMTK